MERMRIGIIEDERSHGQFLSRCIQAWGEDAGVNCQITEYGSAEAFLFAWEDDRAWDVLFLDIQMPGMGGMELAKKLRCQSDDVAIVFTTGLTDYMQDGYEVSALHYLVKPIDPGKVASCMNRVRMDGAREDSTTYLREVWDVTEGWPGEKKTVRLTAGKIEYVEALAHETELHVGKSVYRDREGISVWIKRLASEGFVRCHRSYLVNLRFVSCLGKSELSLDSGQHLPVSKRNQREVNAAFIQYYRKDEPE